MGFISYFFAKNNPQSLLDLFKWSNSTEEKEKIVNRLIELEAYNEYEQIWDIVPPIDIFTAFACKHNYNGF
jgi:hypothetical protein